MKNKILIFTLSLTLLISVFSFSASAETDVPFTTTIKYGWEFPVPIGPLNITGVFYNYEFDTVYLGSNNKGASLPKYVNLYNSVTGGGKTIDSSFDNDITITGGNDLNNQHFQDWLKGFEYVPEIIGSYYFPIGWEIPSGYGIFNIWGTAYYGDLPVEFSKLGLGYLGNGTVSANSIKLFHKSTSQYSAFSNDTDFRIEVYGGDDINNQAFLDFIEGNIYVPEPDEPDTPVQTECDGSSCPATDKNFDNVCDDCMLMFAVPRSYDLYNYNGHSFPRKFTKSNGDTWYLNDIYNEIKSSYGSVVLLSNGNFDSSMVYVLVNLTNNPQTPLVVKNGQAVLTGGKTMVSLYKAEYDENGVPYWKFSATDTWSTEGALLANTDQIQWSMGNILDENGSVSIAGDVNFRSPLAEEIQGLTAGILKGTTLPAVMKVILTLLLCGVGCLAFLTVFILLRRVFSNSLRT